MKTERITVNKTPQQPQGIDIDLVVPENPLEERVIGFLMVGFLRDLKRENRVPYELPDRFKVEYASKGTFLASAVAAGVYYEAPKPIAMVGLRVLPNALDLVHAPAPGATVTPAPPAQQPAAPTTEPPAASSTGESPAPSAPEGSSPA